MAKNTKSTKPAREIPEHPGSAPSGTDDHVKVALMVARDERDSAVRRVRSQLEQLIETFTMARDRLDAIEARTDGRFAGERKAIALAHATSRAYDAQSSRIASLVDAQNDVALASAKVYALAEIEEHMARLATEAETLRVVGTAKAANPVTWELDAAKAVRSWELPRDAARRAVVALGGDLGAYDQWAATLAAEAAAMNFGGAS